MDSKKYIDDAIEKIMVVTNVYHSEDGTHDLLAMELYYDTIRSKLIDIMCDVIHKTSLDSNMAQECNLTRLRKDHL